MSTRMKVVLVSTCFAPFLLLFSLTAMTIFWSIGQFTNYSMFYQFHQLRSITDGSLNLQKTSIYWTSGTDFTYQDFVTKAIRSLDAKYGNNTVIIPPATMSKLKPSKFSVSSDKKYVLLAHHRDKISRRSHRAAYSVYNVTQKKLFDLKLRTNDGEKSRFSDVQWSSVKHGLAIVNDNDIYYKEEPLIPTSYRITNTGVNGTIYNGVTDWLYSEEIMKSSSAMWFSNNATYLMYGTFNDTNVSKRQVPLESSLNKSGWSYIMKEIRYPKVGEENPLAVFHIADLRNLNSIKNYELQPPNKTFVNGYYITGATWINEEAVSVVYMDRSQTKFMLTVCKSISNWSCQEIIRISSHSRTWINNPGTPIFNPEGDVATLIVPVQYKHESFPQILAVNVTSLNTKTLTHGEFSVKKLLSWDNERQIIFYLASLPNAPDELHLFAANSNVPDDNYTDKVPHCITCKTELPRSYRNGSSVTYGKEEDKFCAFDDIIMSPTSEYYVHRCLGLDVPATFVYKVYNTTVHNYTSLQQSMPLYITTLENNFEVREKYDRFVKPKVDKYFYKLSDGTKAIIGVLLPENVEHDDDYKYPLILQLNDGPEVQLVTSKWDANYAKILACHNHFVVAQIDISGTAGHEYGMGHGVSEFYQYTEIITYLQSKYDFIHENLTGVYGWYYGGYLTSLLLSEPHQKDFHCGVAISPVVDWSQYESVYAERYLGTKWMNYSKGMIVPIVDLTKRAAMIPPESFLLLHGTPDDYVHFEQWMLMKKALDNAGIQYENQVDTDNIHDNSRVMLHIYSSITNFMHKCLKSNLTPADRVKFATNPYYFEYRFPKMEKKRINKKK